LKVTYVRDSQGEVRADNLETFRFRQESQKPSWQNGAAALASQKGLALAGMNPDLLADGSTDFCLDAFNEAPADPVKFVGGPDCGGNFQRGLFHLTPAKVRSGVDAF